jgi:hypothetical protein
VFHPTKPSAVGSRNSLAQEGRRQKEEFDQLIQEETQNILDLVQTKLPKEVLEKLEVMGGLKEKLYNYFNQNYQNMFNRYIVTTEDEMTKKVRNFIDKEEGKTLARYTPKEVAELLDQIAGADKFNTGEIEKSIVNMFGHLHGHIQRGVNDLENETNSLLRQKTDVGAFVRGENAYSIVKCSFKDNVYKPKTVTDVKLSVNILDSELISPIFHYQSTVEYLIKDMISRTITNYIEKELENLQEQLIEEGKEELQDTEIIFEKMKRVPNYTDDEIEDEKSKRYGFLAKNLLDKIEGLRAEIDPKEFDPLNIRENLKKIVDMENVRNRGFNTAINSITAILDTSKMGYQYIENLKNARELVLREYEDVDATNLPDERYQIRLKYYDAEQLSKEQDAYDKQMEAFKNEIFHLWDVIEAIYQGNKHGFRVNDFDDLSRKVAGSIKKSKKDSSDPLYEEIEKTWNKIVLIRSELTDVERLNQTYLYEKNLYKKMLGSLRAKISGIYGYQNPQVRVIVDNEINFLQREFEAFDYLINPYHVQPGLLLDVDITSIKRKRYTMMAMANVLNEFLSAVSKGFQDAAFATFKRRRSTVRADLNQSFATDSEEAPLVSDLPKGPAAYSSEPAAGEEVKGKADVTPAPSKRRGGSTDGLAEL